jgi:hypothetical protein
MRSMESKEIRGCSIGRRKGKGKRTIVGASDI